MELQWYLVREGEQHGPYYWNDLISFFNEGNLLANDLLWNETMPDWQRADAIKEFGFIEETPVETKPPLVNSQTILNKGINIAKKISPVSSPPTWKVIVGEHLPQLPKDLNALKTFLGKR